MKIVSACAAGLVVAFLITPAHGRSGVRSDNHFVDPASLASELGTLQRLLTVENAEQVRAALPSVWRVRTPDGDYSISTLPLRTLLAGSSSDRMEAAQSWLKLLAAEIGSYSSPGRHVPEAQAILARILARPEFARNAAPNAWERFWERVGAEIARWMKRLFAFSRSHSTSSAAFFWLALAGAVSLIAFFVFRLFHRDKYDFKLAGSQPASAVRSWERWIMAARIASEEGDLRRAIQCTYWAGVARLQESRVLPEGTTYTPREYLRLLTSPPQREAADHGMVPLRTLTLHLERFWYGRAAASVEDFSVCIGSLEALGCKVD